MKFGKSLLEESLPEYSEYYMDYKQLKKIISKLEKQDKEKVRNSFFVSLQAELEKVNTFYVDQENLILQRLDNLQNLSIHQGKASLLEAYNSLLNEVDKLQQFISLNQTGFIKILKKWDKRSKSSLKELYLTRQIDVQPCFDNKLIEIGSKINTQIESIHENKDYVDNDSVYSSEVHSNVDITILHAVRDLLKSNHLESFLLSLSADVIGKVMLSFICHFPIELIPKLLVNFDINGIRDEVHFRGIIHVAAIHGRKDLLEILLDHNANVYLTDFYGRTAMHYSGMEGHFEATKYLLTKSNGNILDKDKYTPLLYVIKNNKIGLIDLFKNTEIPDHLATTPLLMACNKGNLVMVQCLLNKYKVESYQGQHPLHICARYGHVSVLQYIISFCSNLNEYDAYGYTALMYAVIQGHFDCVALLLAKEADPRLLDENGWNCFNHATYRGHLKIAELFSIYEIKELKLNSPIMLPCSPSDIPLFNLPPPLLPFRIYGHSYLQNDCLIELRLGAYTQVKALRLSHKEHMMRTCKIIIQVPNQLPFQVNLPGDDINRSIMRIRCHHQDQVGIKITICPSFGEIPLATGLLYLDNKDGLNQVKLHHKDNLVGHLMVESIIITPIQINNNSLTYWKSALPIAKTNSPSLTPKGLSPGSQKDLEITSSSLKKKYSSIRVQLTKDLIPVVYDHIFLPISNNGIDLDICISDVTYNQFMGFEMGTGLADFIKLHDNIHIDLFLLQNGEFEQLNKQCPYGINEFVDAVLKIVYEHTKTILFSSFNPDICMALNWKQPSCIYN